MPISVKGEPVSWGIIGCGDVTELKSGPAFNKVQGSKLIAVMRRNAALAKDYALRHDVPYYFSDAGSLIQHPEVNAVYIATPPNVHEEYVLQCIDAGKPVYVEKPMALTFQSACKMQRRAAEAQVKLVVAHYRRAQPMYQELKKLIDGGAIGRPMHVSIDFRRRATTNEELNLEKISWRHDPAISGGGLFHDLAPHQLGILYFLFGEPIHASGYASNISGATAADDLVSGLVLFNEKVHMSGAWCFNARIEDECDSCTVYGTAGYLNFGFFNTPVIYLHNSKGVQAFEFKALQHVQQPMIAQVVDYFRNGGINPCPPEEGMAVMKIMESFTGKNWDSLTKLAF